MATYGNKKLIASEKELPVVNGRRIHAIYGRMETAYSGTNLLEDAYNKKPDYYLLCTKDIDYSKPYETRSQLPNIKTLKLPTEIAQFFGEQNLDGYKLFVTRMSFRTSDSGNGSFIDQFCDFEGGCGAQHKSITYYRLDRWKDTPKGTGSTFEGEEYSKKIDAILGKNFTVEELPSDFDTEYPCSYFRKIDGLNYPDLKCDGWRWLYGHPYVSNKYDERGNPDRNNIRAYVKEIGAHVYLSKATELFEGEEYIRVNFSWDYSKKPNQFCEIGQWSDSKKEDPFGLIKWKILSIDNKKGKNPIYKIGAMVNDKVQFIKESEGDNLYSYRMMFY